MNPEGEPQKVPFARSWIKAWGCLLAVVCVFLCIGACISMLLQLLGEAPMNPAVKIIGSVIAGTGIISYLLCRLLRK